MPTIYPTLEAATIVLALVTVRFALVVQLVPFLGGKGAPQAIKLAVAMALSALMFPQALHLYLANPPSPVLLAILAFKEAMVGLTLGLVTSLTFDALRIAGQLIDTTRGQNLATALVPQLPERLSVTSVLLYELAIVLFLLAGGHLIFYDALLRSFAAFPLFEIPKVPDDFTVWILRRFADSMLFAIELAIPTITAVLLADLVLGMVNKAAPQIQVFFLGMPAKATLGIFLVFLTLTAALQDFWLPHALVNMDTLHQIMSPR